MNRLPIIIIAFTLFIAACGDNEPESSTISLKGHWVVETDGSSMLDPQTSGLKLWRGMLLSVSDASAHLSQIKQLHIIDPSSAQLAEQSLVMEISAAVAQSCFAGYLNDSPDLEALAVHPDNDRVFVVVTEDATRSVGMSEECQQRYQQTGSTDYPTLLIRLELQDDKTLVMTHARPLSFKTQYGVGNFPNDGIEGLAFGPDRTLYLGLEKDSQDKARIFSVNIDVDFWQSDEFAPVNDEQLLMPNFSKGNHPINGMDYMPAPNHKGYIVAAARNDNQLWILDLEKQRPAKQVDLAFLAPTSSNGESCAQWELMDNSSLEGLAVVGDTIWMINDPWRAHYKDNIQCERLRENYERMAPLLFSMPIDESWYKP